MLSIIALGLFIASMIAFLVLSSLPVDQTIVAMRRLTAASSLVFLLVALGTKFFPIRASHL